MEEKEWDIEIIQDEKSENGEAQLPLNILSFGEIEKDDVKVYIRQKVYKALEAFAASDTSKELGSILIGSYCQALGSTHVIISDYIEAKFTDASASTLTFTHETWDYVHKQQDALYPDKKIVGWQHTHPSYGIFLSNYDLFIQENFFNLPFQIAYVIDPVQDIRGFFQWKNGKIEKLKGYYVYDDVGKPIKIPQKKRPESGAGTKRPGGRAVPVVLGLLCALTLGLGAFSLVMNGKYNQQLEMQASLAHQVEQQEAVIREQEEDMADLQSQVIAGLLDTNGVTAAREWIEKLENHTITIENQDAVLRQLKELVAAAEAAPAGEDGLRDVVLKAYTVKPGDNLSGICKACGIDYAANKNSILSLNGIADPDAIYPGQVILLPVS